MNLQEALNVTQLRQKARIPNVLEIREQLAVAKHVFEVAAAGGGPYENLKPEDWARRWLVSRNFILAEIAPHAVAVPYVNRIDASKVQATMHCSIEEVEPIVVDLNKQGIGATDGGYVPKIIVVDGKHRHRAQVLQGRDRVLAWVGEDALTAIEERNQQRKPFAVQASSKVTPRYGSRLENLAQLHAAIAGPGAAMARQGAGDGGVGGVMKGKGARSSGQLEKTGNTDPSDKLQWKANDPNFCAPGCTEDHAHQFIGVDVSKDDGASKSALRKKIVAGPIKVKKIETSPKKNR